MANGNPTRSACCMVEFHRDLLRRIGGGVVFALAFGVSQSHLFGILFSLPLVAIGALLLMPELTRPVTWMIDALMGTQPGRGERPPIDLRLARFYVANERLDEALEEYARVMKWHPGISEPYEETMILLARTGAPRKEIDRVHQIALRRMRSPEARHAIESARRRALETRPDPVNGDTARRA